MFCGFGLSLDVAGVTFFGFYRLSSPAQTRLRGHPHPPSATDPVSFFCGRESAVCWKWRMDDFLMSHYHRRDLASFMRLGVPAYSLSTNQSYNFPQFSCPNEATKLQSAEEFHQE
jgi:hypothetical protein